MSIIEPKLAGLRVLLLEDSFLVAASIAAILRDLGCRVVGPFNNNSDARDVVLSGGCDAAVLDINLGSETSEPIAENLAESNVPFLFVTSYTSPALVNPRFSAFQRVHKPLSREALADALVRSIHPPGPAAGTPPPVGDSGR